MTERVQPIEGHDDIVIVGSRGIPANYGGFETFAEELSRRLVREGLSVTVACEHSPTPVGAYHGVKLEYFPFRAPRHYMLRKLYEVLNDTYFMIRLARRARAMYVLGAAAGPVMFLPRLLNPRLRLMVNVDGLEWRRDKFTRTGKFLLRFNTNLAARSCHVVVVDANAIRSHLPRSTQRKAVFVPYGAEPPTHVSWDGDRLSRTHPALAGIARNEFWLVVARLEPENSIHEIIEGFARSCSARPLIVVGNFTDDRYRGEVERILHDHPRANVFLVGGIYDPQSLNTLRQNAFAYIHGHTVGGTNPSLLEAMAMRNLVVGKLNEFNREVGADSLVYFRDADHLASIVRDIETAPEKYHHLRDLAAARVSNHYSWDSVIARYRAIFRDFDAGREKETPQRP
ncbi:MAG: DUF1972 domain-containing protein [Thermoplasmatota archaeon]